MTVLSNKEIDALVADHGMEAAVILTGMPVDEIVWACILGKLDTQEHVVIDNLDWMNIKSEYKAPVLYTAVGV